MWRSAPRFVALVRVFFARFFEHEGAAGDLRGAFAWLMALLAAPGLIIPPFVAFAWSRFDPADQTQWGWLRIASRLGVDALRVASLGDKATYLAFACTATASVAALVWNSLLPDRRDALVLGALPVTSGTVVRARLAALLVFALVLAVGTHAFAALTFGVLLAAGSRASFAFRGIAAHFVASVLATVFVFSTVVALQGVIVLVGGARWARRLSFGLQAAVVAATLAAFFAVGDIGPATRAFFQHGIGTRPWWIHTPPLWFLGLYESMLGTTNPLLVTLARTALVWTALAVACSLFVYPLVYRRVCADALSQPVVRPRRAEATRRRVRAFVSSTSPAGGLTQFFVATITRVERHRLILAAACGIAATWTVVSWLALPPPASWRYPPMRFFAIPLAVQFLLLVGLRASASVPSDLAPAWLFDLVTPSRRDGRAALERVMGAAVIVPVAAISSFVVWASGGVHAALFHAALTMAAGAALAEVALGEFHDVPCAQAVRPDVETARMRWPLYLAGFAVFTTAFAGLESLFVTSIVAPKALGPYAPDFTIWRLVFVALLAALAVLVRRKALSQSALRDGEDFAMLSRAIQEGRENVRNHATGATVDDTRTRHAAGSVFNASVADPDSWFAGFSARPVDLWRDMRLGMRRLLKAPAFALFSILTLAVAIGATTAIYSAVASVLRQPAGFTDPDRVLTIGASPPGGRPASMSWPDFLDLRAAATTLAGIDAESPFPAALTTDAGATRVNGALVTRTYFQTVGVAPLVGRVLAPYDDEPDAAPAIVLSEQAWRLYFGSDPAIVGRAVRVAGAVYQIVGVMPRTFRGVTTLLLPPAFWTSTAHPPLTDGALTTHRDSTRRDRPYLQVVGRMKPDVTRGQVDTEIAALSRRIDLAEPLKDRAGRAEARGWTAVRADAARWSVRTMGMSAFVVLLPVLVLLVACTNLANLVMSRGAKRQDEMLVRRALGASRWSLVRAELVEHGLLCMVGGLGGVAVAHVLITQGLAFILRTFGSTPQTQFDVRLDGHALAAAVVGSVLAVGVAALVPAIRLTRRTAQGQALGDLTTGMLPGRRLESHLISFQVAASLALLLLAAVCMRQLIDVRHGFDLDVDLSRVAVATVDFDLRTHEDARVLELGERIRAEVLRVAGIDAVAIGTGIPQLERNGEHGPTSTAGSSDIVRVLGLPLLTGRSFLPGDSPSVAVISESEARAAFGGTGVVGRELVLTSETSSGSERRLTVVGVVADAGRDVVTHEGLRQVYVPFALTRDPRVPMPPVWLLARVTSGDARLGATALTRAIRTVDPDLPIRFSGSADVLATGPIATLTLVSELLGCLAGLALALSVTGLYSVTSHLVANRTREIGIRLALGADPWSIVRLVMANAIRPVSYGLAFGVVAAVIARASLRPPLFPPQLARIDAISLALAIVPLVIASAVACYVPARRAASLDPNDALRQV